MASACCSAWRPASCHYHWPRGNLAQARAIGCFTPDAYIDFYWVSSSEALHSQNIARRPDISIVVFDSQVPIGATEAAYMSARAKEIADSDLELCAEIYSGRLPEARGFGPEQLRAPALLRLYRATVAEHSILIRGGDPDHGRGVDSRMTLTLTR